MVDWEKVQVSHVIKTCCKVVNKWWGADISFLDEFGNCKVYLPVNNALCSFLSSTERGSKLCKKNYFTQVKHVRKDRRPLFYRCFAGLDGVIIPIIVKGDYVGSIVCYGINMTRIEARQKEYIEKLVKSGFDREGVELSYKN